MALADAVILPGVGAAAPAMAAARAWAWSSRCATGNVPLLGICLGMQLLFDSEEGDVECLGLLPGRVRKLRGRRPASAFRTWAGTACSRRATSPLLDGMPDAQAYFVHSYAAPVSPIALPPADAWQRFAAMVQRGNVAGAQFHPERSATGRRAHPAATS
jgi:glutamine amidotransferase